MKNYKLFFLLIFFFLLISFVIDYLFVKEDLYYLYYGDTLKTDSIIQMLEMKNKWEWVGYAFLPIVILIRISFTSICLYIGFFLKKIKASLKDLFIIALLADFVFVLSGFTKFVILIFFKEVNTLDDLQFQPFSLMGFFEKTKVETFLAYPLSLINLFELLYFLVLAWLLADLFNQSFKKSFQMVTTSYGTGLLLWVLFVIFLTVNLS